MGVLDNTLLVRVEALEAELAAIRMQSRPRSSPVAETAADEPRESAGRPVSDRRGVVKLLAATAVGAVAGSALHGQQVAADDGDPVVQGTVNDASTATTLNATDENALVLWSGVGQGLETNGAYGNARFDADGDSPIGEGAWAGTLWVDKDGNWWAATKSDADDGQWRKLAGVTTAGALHLLSAPKRVYDSRPGEAPPVGTKTPLAGGTPRAVDVTLNSSGVPPQALGAIITLTVTGTGGPGFAAVWPSGVWPGSSSINFTGANQTIATTTVVGLSTGATFQIQSNTSTHVIIDVIGYYL